MGWISSRGDDAKQQWWRQNEPSAGDRTGFHCGFGHKVAFSVNTPLQKSGDRTLKISSLILTVALLYKPPVNHTMFFLPFFAAALKIALNGC